MPEKPVGLMREVTSFITRYSSSIDRRIGMETFPEEIPHAALAYISQHPLAQEFDLSHEPILIGTGWNGAIYRVGSAVIKINYDVQPVEGFGYKNTKAHAERAQQNLDLMRNEAQKLGLPHLITDEQRYFHIPAEVMPDNKERLVLVQRHYDHLLTSNKVKDLFLSNEEKVKLENEFKHFMQLFVNLANHPRNRLLVDLFGQGNLALHKFDDGYHFVLSDVGPAEMGIAGPITRFGLWVSLGREITRWGDALHVSN